MEPVITSIQGALETLAACLCLGVQNDNDGTEFCFCGVIPGQGVPDFLSACTKGGVAYTRLITSYPSQTVGQIDQTEGNCAAGIGFDVEVGIYRNFPIRSDGLPLGSDAMLAVSRQQQQDIETMRTAIACCAWVAGKDYIIGQWNPVGPQGAWIGGVFTVYGWTPSQFPG